MAPRGQPAVFLERRTYRRRRMMDAARVLPILGAILFLLPLLWRGHGVAPVATSAVYLYLFGIWAVLIVGSVILGRFARHWPGAAPLTGEDLSYPGAGPPGGG
ncbi:MAG: hypothetical protein ACWA5A_11440 [Marinibacterium sp.]